MWNYLSQPWDIRTGETVLHNTLQSCPRCVHVCLLSIHTSLLFGGIPRSAELYSSQEHHLDSATQVHLPQAGHLKGIANSPGMVKYHSWPGTSLVDSCAHGSHAMVAS